MKCKKGYKIKDGECIKVKKKSRTLDKRFMKRLIAIILFAVFSLVLFINNVTDLFVKFGLYVPIQWITWIGIILTSVYTWWLNLGGGK